MFNKFLTALLQKILLFSRNNPRFFDQTEQNRQKNLKDFSVPESFKNYLAAANEKEFLADIMLIVRFIKSPEGKGLKNNRFFLALTEFLTSELAKKIDLLDSSYYLLTSNERALMADKLLKGDSLLAKSLKEILINNTYQQLAAGINQLAAKITSTSYLVIQSPREISHELKREIREGLKSETGFPVFQINKKLIGGIRIFKNGTSNDRSWLSRVLRFTSLTSA